MFWRAGRRRGKIYARSHGRRRAHHHDQACGAACVQSMSMSCQAAVLVLNWKAVWLIRTASPSNQRAGNGASSKHVQVHQTRVCLVIGRLLSPLCSLLSLLSSLLSPLSTSCTHRTHQARREGRLDEIGVRLLQFGLNVVDDFRLRHRHRHRLSHVLGPATMAMILQTLLWIHAPRSKGKVHACRNIETTRQCILCLCVVSVYEMHLEI